MAYKKLNIDPETVEKLAILHCTIEEMAGFLGCSRDTLERKYAAIINKGRQSGKISLRRLQWRAAEAGSYAMMIWLGKQTLGQKDVSRIEMDKIPDDVFMEEAQRRLGAAKPESDT